jgi:tRNA dimethylallyltransferase
VLGAFDDIPNGPILIAGPTASGKSALAIWLAQHFGGRIINADAIQVFEGWRILTARPDDDDLSKAKHCLYGHIPFDADYSVGHWLRDVKPMLTGDQRPIIVGGTGLYFTALTKGLADIPPVPLDIREDANALAASSGFQVMLNDLDEKTKSRIDLNNPMRVQRAWEVWRATGRQIADWQDNTPPPLLNDNGLMKIVLNSSVEWLGDRIERRFDKMLESGALEEAERMLPHWDPDLLSSKAIGAKELISHLKGEISLENARELSTIASRQYAKRQRTWFRSKMTDWLQLNSDRLEEKLS